MASNTLPVAFRNTTLSLIDHNGEPFVAMKPVVTGMGLAWQSQAEKIKASAARWTVTEIVMVAEDGKQRAQSCIPLRKLPGWLATVSPNRVRPELRDTILAYQRECDDVLWAHWNRTRSPDAAAAIVSPDFADPAHRLRCWAKAVAAGKPSPGLPAELLDGVIADLLWGSRYLVSFDSRLNPVLHAVPPGAVVIVPDELPKLLADTGSVFRRGDMPAIIDAAVKRLAGTVPRN